MELKQLTDADLVNRFQDIVIDEQEKLALQLEYLAELDRRKLFFHYPSLRAYLVAEHGLEEWQAERRIRAARLLLRFPGLKRKLETGQLNLTLLEIAQGCAHREKLKDGEIAQIFEDISGMSCRAAQRELASRYPNASAEVSRDRVRPLTGELSEVRFVATEELLIKLEEIRGLVAHAYPPLTMGDLIDLLATDYRNRHHPEERAKRAQEREVKRQSQESPQSPSKRIEEPTAPLPVISEEQKRTPSRAMVSELILRDGYQCSYVDPVRNLRCGSQFALEIDHQTPWALGGKTELSNLKLQCRQHHRRISFLQFGESSQYFGPALG